MQDGVAAPEASDLRGQYGLTRFLFLRFLGFIYFLGFLVAARQAGPLIGHDGLLPVPLYLERVASTYGAGWPSFITVPTLFWLNASDAFMQAMAEVGCGLSLVVLARRCQRAAAGGAVVPVHVLRPRRPAFWYGYGWEILLLETGFLAIFLCPLLDPRPIGRRGQPPRVVIWLLRWVLFRVMFGAGLIKLRGDPCWRDLTCMSVPLRDPAAAEPVQLVSASSAAARFTRRRCCSTTSSS